MAAENRRNTQTAFRLTALLLSAGLIAVIAFCFRISGEIKTAESHILQLESEQKGLQDQIEQTEAQLAEKETEIEELNSAEESLKNTRAEYYETCRLLEEEILAGKNPNKIAYLTFDDGPYEKTTGRYLDVLKDRDVLATFFQIGRPSEKLGGLYHRAFDEGHTIANHTYSHQIRNGIYRGVDYFVNLPA